MEFLVDFEESGCGVGDEVRGIVRFSDLLELVQGTLDSLVHKGLLGRARRHP